MTSQEDSLAEKRTSQKDENIHSNTRKPPDEKKTSQEEELKGRQPDRTIS